VSREELVRIGGTVTVSSGGAGEGATFVVTVPRLDQAGA